MLNGFCGGGVIKCHHSQSAGHAFKHHIAKSFSLAGKPKNIGGRVILRQDLTGLNAWKNGIWRKAFELGACGAITHQHQLHVRAHQFGLGISPHQQLQIFFAG